jgi:hypothetical protein
MLNAHDQVVARHNSMLVALCLARHDCKVDQWPSADMQSLNSKSHWPTLHSATVNFDDVTGTPMMRDERQWRWQRRLGHPGSMVQLHHRLCGVSFVAQSSAGPIVEDDDAQGGSSTLRDSL